MRRPLVKGAFDDKLIACGREAITSIAVDANLVVWAEQGKGVFQAQR